MVQHYYPTVQWDFGDGSSASGSLTTNHIYTDNGVYTVILTVTDNAGGVGSDSLNVTVTNVAPQVDAGPDQTVNEGDTVTFNGSFSDAGVDDTHTIEWNFGDGSPPVAGNLSPSHIYPDNGVYTVTLTVTDNAGGVGSDTLQVTVNDLGPTAVLTGDTLLNEGQAGSYDAGGSSSSPDAIVAYEWDWDYDGNTFSPSGDSGVTQTHSWTTEGVYTVAVRVTDDDGSSSIASLLVTVQDNVTQPEPPIDGLYARAKSEKINLVWAPVATATGYNVYRSTTQGGPYTPVAMNHQCDYCAFADFGLNNGTTYYYVVTWISGGAESAYSNEASATPQARILRTR